MAGSRKSWRRTDALPAASVLGIAFLLSACSVFGTDEVAAPQAPAVSAPITSCQQQAQALGFQVIRVDPPETDANGITVTPLLVNWGQNGGVHLTCRPGPNGTVTVG